MYDRMGELLGSTALHVGLYVPPDSPPSVAGLPELADLAQDRQTDHLLDHTGLGPGEHLLDIGCGTGGPAVRLAGRGGGRVTGITVSRVQVERCRERARAAGLADRLDFRHGDAMDLEFDDEVFDAAWAIDSLTHMRDRPRALREAHRVLRPGGRLLLTEFTLRGTPPEAELAAFTEMWSAGAPSSLSGLLAETEEAGFHAVRLWDLTANMRISGEVMGALFADRRAEIEARCGAETARRTGELLVPFRAFCRGHLEYHLMLVRK
ncbi:methyltransferase domain-containing protein [Streptomyces sp. SB3404]|uniref:Methyltransferase domain-containing protein n=2 Tax=Streptomyces boncukensis TaxID=2711219 RepID=A0A6G4X2Z6_9ACTN|nr:methyltransferase domain-containing protein [Streptomyces boncukensis]